MYITWNGYYMSSNGCIYINGFSLVSVLFCQVNPIFYYQLLIINFFALFKSILLRTTQIFTESTLINYNQFNDPLKSITPMILHLGAFINHYVDSYHSLHWLGR